MITFFLWMETHFAYTILKNSSKELIKYKCFTGGLPRYGVYERIMSLPREARALSYQVNVPLETTIG